MAHEGNLTRAALRLNVSQSALSVQIKRLEERLGHALFERRGRSLVLTEAGRISLDHADAIFAAGDELLSTLQQSGRSRQALRVGALATLSRNFQLQFLQPVLSRPDVEVILRSGTMAELLFALEGLSLDVVLTNQPPPMDAGVAYVAQRMAEQSVSVIGTPDYVEQGSLVDLLAGAPLLLPPAQAGIRMALDAYFSQHNLRPQIAAEVDDMAMLRLLTAEGLGLGIMPPIVVQDELATGQVLELARMPDIVETFYAVTVSRRFPNPLLAELVSASSPPAA